MRALGDEIPRGGPREQLRSQRERSTAKGSNTSAAATLPGSRRTVASKGVFSARNRTSSRNVRSCGQVKSIARKIDAACGIASSRFSIRIQLRCFSARRQRKSPGASMRRLWNSRVFFCFFILRVFCFCCYRGGPEERFISDFYTHSGRVVKDSVLDGVRWR